MSNLDMYDPIYLEEDSDDEEISKMKFQFREYRRRIKKLEGQYIKILRRKKRYGLELIPPLQIKY